ncbi:MAG: sulfatase-like hydrolase/transferase, partial [Hyphomicrobiaceae bacterium]
DEKNALYRENAGETHGAAQTWHSKLPVAWHNSTWTADRAIDWLKRKRDQPFMTWISFPDPHHPFDCPEPWSRLHHPDEVDIPRHRERDLDNRPWWHRAVLDTAPTGTKKNAEIRKAYSRISPQRDEQLREIIANTYGQIALIDHQVGRILITLDELRLRDNTVVIYSSDHGDWLGDHGLVLKGPMHYEGLHRVGMIVRGPSIAAGQTISAPTSTIDVGPTLFDYAGCEAMQTQHGQSLRPLLETDQGRREYAYSEWELHPNRAGVALSLRTVRTQTAKLTVDQISGDGELYDLANDPDEMANRFHDPDYKALKDQLLGYIARRPNDIGPVNEPVGMA